MDGNNQIKFTTSEFSKVFKRIKEKENKQGFYCVRQLNKFHAAQFEERIDSGHVNIENLVQLATSKFADQIQNLTVRIPGDLGDLSDLCLASPTFLPKVQKVNVIFTEGQSENKQITLSQQLVFRGLNVVHEKYRGFIKISCQNYQVQLINTNFDDIGLCLTEANKVTVQNSSFSNVTENFPGLNCDTTKNTTTIDNVRFVNCVAGLFIGSSFRSVYLNKLHVENCLIGCFFLFVFGELRVNDAEIVNCETGMEFQRAKNSIVQNCNIIDALKKGIRLGRSTVQYRQIFINQQDGIEGEFEKVDLDALSTFSEIL